MTDREKLIELLGENTCHREGCYDCDYDGDKDACVEYFKSSMADHLLANGVRLKSKQATSDENKRWITVTERLPEHGKVVLVCGKRGAIYTAWCNTLHKNPGWHKLNSKNHYCDPTHWMPLPEPPKEG